MRTKFKGLLTLLLALVVQVTFAQQKKVSGTVTDAQTGEPLPGVNIQIKGTNKGTTTDFDGKFTITVSPEDVLVFSYIGYQPKEVKVGDRTQLDVKLVPGEKLGPVVVDITGEKKEVKTLSYAVQPVKAEELDISDISNVQAALSGKVAGAQVWEQAGSKLGYAPKIRIRGRISLSTDSDPLYVVDGVPVTDASVVDPDDVASIEVLKGPNATAIYGQRGENGVVVITTKSAKKGKFGVTVNSKVTFEKIAYLPKYQNWYGQGARGDGAWKNYDYGVYSSIGYQRPEWSAPAFQGVRYNYLTVYDESWGPKFDGQDYMPWYAWVPGSPYFGQTAKWVAQPDNVKSFYDTGIYVKNNVSLFSGTDKYSARLSFANLDQKGTIPFSTYKRYYVTSNVTYNVTDNFKVGVQAIYSQFKRHGDFDDQYGNQTSGSFNAWFARDLDMSKEKELMNLKTPEGYFASWNWWGPLLMAVYSNYGLTEGMKKPVFWFNHYTWVNRYDRNGLGNYLTANIWAKYNITKNLAVKVNFNRFQSNRNANYHLPYEIEYSSAHDLYTSWINSFGLHNVNRTEDNYNAWLLYNTDLTDDFKLDAMLGTTLRSQHYNRITNWMDPEDMENGMIIPDVYRFDNTKKPVIAIIDKRRKKVLSLYGKTTFSYKDLVFLELTGRQDWSSALFPNHNGYFYPSAGLTVNFSDFDAFQDNEFLSNYISSGKFRIGWAQVGSDVPEHWIYPRYPIMSDVSYMGYATLLTPNYTVDPNLKPALNSSFETGVDLKFLKNRLGLNFTYYYEKRKDEIIRQAISGATGYSQYLTNGGQSHRSGIELTLSGTPIQKKDFEWNMDFNFAQNKTIIDEVPGDAKEMFAPGGRRWSHGDTWGRIALVHREGMEWGQLKGYDIRRDKNGNPVLANNGYYLRTKDQVYFGSVLPKFTGGFTNVFKYKGLSLAAHFTFQKGGKFFSGSEVWGYYSGLYEETGMNGNREAGVDVIGVDENGNAVKYNVSARNYYKQFHRTNIAGPFVHDASYLKLRELSLNYTLPKSILGNGKYLKSATVGIIGTNVWLIAVAKDNYHRWDPSELSQPYGEDAQLPGTRRIGLNVKLSF